MDISVNVDNVDLTSIISGAYGEDRATLGEAIVTELVARIAKTDHYAGLVARVREIRDDEIRTAVAEACEAPIKRTNTYGEVVGGPTTLRELIIEEAKKYLNSPASDYDRNKGTRLEVTVRAAVKAAFEKEIADAVKTARAAVADDLGAQIAKGISDQVQQAMRAR